MNYCRYSKIVFVLLSVLSAAGAKAQFATSASAQAAASAMSATAGVSNAVSEGFRKGASSETADKAAPTATPAQDSNEKPGQDRTRKTSVSSLDEGESDEASRGSAKSPMGGNTPAQNEFQKFVALATGKNLPIFGANFFSSGRASSNAVNSPVPMDYRLGIGDEVVVRLWGTVNADFTGHIDQEGMFNIPRLGSMPLAGVRRVDAEGVIRTFLEKYYKGFNLSVSPGKLRGLTVYVVGQARRPGTYTVSSLSTVISALAQADGPNAIGSLRRIQLKRGGQQIAELDLYAFLSKGDKSSDSRLQDGDVIVIPPALGYVALTGELETQAVFELRGKDDNLENLLALTGGLPIVTNPFQAVIEHLDPKQSKPRSVATLALDETSLKRPLSSGDIVTLLPIRPEFSNAVVLRGVIDSPLRVPFKSGMRISDLIPSRDYLLTRATISRLNDLQSMRGVTLGGVYEQINWDYAVVERMNRKDLKEDLIVFSLARALDAPESRDNVVLQPGDRVNLFAANDLRLPTAKRQVFVRIEGEVQRPGIYPVEPGETLPNVVQRAGGFTADAFPFGSELTRLAVRAAQQANLDKFLQKLEQEAVQANARSAANITAADALSAQTQQLRISAEAEARRLFIQRMRTSRPNGRIALDVQAQDMNVAALPNMKLENGDTFIVPPRPDFIQIFGAVNSDSTVLWKPGRSISDYVAQTGITKEGDKGNLFVVRANGSVISNSDRTFSSVGGMEALPGDVIVVPEKGDDKETFFTAFTRITKDWTQILANFGLGAAAIRTLK